METLGVITLILFGTIGIIGLVTISMVIRAFVVVKLWAWFIVPFAAMGGWAIPKLTIPIAIGFTMLWALLSGEYMKYNQGATDDEAGKKQIIHLFAAIFLAPFVTLFVAWIVRGFIS